MSLKRIDPVSRGLSGPALCYLSVSFFSFESSGLGAGAAVP